jgi:hypothetical protein
MHLWLGPVMLLGTECEMCRFDYGCPCNWAGTEREILMEYWMTLKKGSVAIYMEYGYTHTSNLSAENIRLRVGPHLELALDLDRNLRTRNKETNSFIDARALAHGELTGLRFIQIEDSSLPGEIEEQLKQSAVSVQDVTLTIDLARKWSFRVAVEHAKGPWLALRVLSHPENPRVSPQK